VAQKIFGIGGRLTVIDCLLPHPLQMPGFFFSAAAVLAIVNAHRFVFFPLPDRKHEEKKQKHENGRAEHKKNLHACLFLSPRKITTGCHFRKYNVSPPPRQSLPPQQPGRTRSGRAAGNAFAGAEYQTFLELDY
jgi:hypothetical protein